MRLLEGYQELSNVKVYFNRQTNDLIIEADYPLDTSQRQLIRSTLNNGEILIINKNQIKRRMIIMKKYEYDIPTYSSYEYVKRDLSKVLDIIETINCVINNLENEGSIKSNNILDAIQVQPRIIYLTNSGTSQEKIIKLNELKSYYEGLRDEYLKEVARLYEDQINSSIETYKNTNFKGKCYDSYEYLIAIDGEIIEDNSADSVIEIGENRYKELANSTVWYDDNTKAMIITSDCELGKNYVTQIKTTLNNGQILYVPKQTYGVLIDNKIYDGTKVVFDFKEDSVELKDEKSGIKIAIPKDNIENIGRTLKDIVDETEKSVKECEDSMADYIKNLYEAVKLIKRA